MYIVKPIPGPPTIERSDCGGLTTEGLNQIVNIKASMNLGLSEKLKLEFPGYTPVKRPVINNDSVLLDPHWISGFVSGCEAGNFDVRMPSTNSKLGTRVQLRFRISQHSRDIKLLEKIAEYFGPNFILVFYIPKSNYYF